MSVFAAVMTGLGAGAISTIGVCGESAETIIKKIFNSTSKKDFPDELGVCVGVIADGDETIDQVTVGCEGENNFAIHCHGNPLIVEMIMQLLEKNGAKLVTSEKLLTEISDKSLNAIEIEAKLRLSQAKTLEASKLICNQIEGGLNKAVLSWQEKSLETIKSEAKQILEVSLAARLIIDGCGVVLIGPANSGKSTLLNCLSGREKAIVTEIKGTTRDYVTGSCTAGPVMLELVDTAGLDEALKSAIDKAAQEKALQLLEQADLVMMVLDGSEQEEQIDKKVAEKIAGKKIITVLNKSDLPSKLDKSKFANAVEISAKDGSGIEDLKGKVLELLGVGDFDLGQAIAFTDRQEKLLAQLCDAETDKQGQSITTELLNGKVCV
ncbi:MAG: GTP-binding protein [Planctomycetes bacterium]|nr:GTP-binding protein [Planctomycetota bacterium]